MKAATAVDIDSLELQSERLKPNGMKKNEIVRTVSQSKEDEEIYSHQIRAREEEEEEVLDEVPVPPPRYESAMKNSAPTTTNVRMLTKLFLTATLRVPRLTFFLVVVDVHLLKSRYIFVLFHTMLLSEHTYVDA